MNIEGANYLVTETANLVIIEGSLRLDSMEEYQTIQDLLT